MSPTLLRTKNLRFVIYFHVHEPPHLHVYGSNAHAKFEIESLECTYSKGFSEKALRQIKSYLVDKKLFLMETWHDFQN